VSQGLASASSYRIAGTKGDLRVEPSYNYETELRHYLTIDGQTREQTFEKRDQFAPELTYFSRCILEDEDPEPSGAEGLADVRVMRAIQRSAATRKAESLPPFDRKRRPDMRQNIKIPPVETPEPVHAPSPSER
jgi:predicted dehydrogenase